MIKKNLKTLDELQNPGKDLPPYHNTEGRWRIWIGDEHIDVDSLRERNRLLNELNNMGYETTINVDFIPNRVLENITLDFTILPTPKPEHPFKKLLKEKLGKWDWTPFFGVSMIVFIFGFISGSIMYLSNLPKTDISYFDSVAGTTFMGISLCTLLWFTDKIWKLLPFITCWFKMLAFIIFFLFIGMTIGLLMSENNFDRVMSFIARYTLTNNENRVLKAATGEES